MITSTLGRRADATWERGADVAARTNASAKMPAILMRNWCIWAHGWSDQPCRNRASAADHASGAFFELSPRADRIGPRARYAIAASPLITDLPTPKASCSRDLRETCIDLAVATSFSQVLRTTH